MTLEAWMIGGVAVPVIMVAAMWGDMRRQTTETRLRQDERHRENQDALHELREEVKDVRDDVRNLNGSVTANKVTLDYHASEIRRLRKD